MADINKEQERDELHRAMPDRRRAVNPPVGAGCGEDRVRCRAHESASTSLSSAS